MRLPDTIEKEIFLIEAEYERRPGQHAGVQRLRGLRWALEDFLRTIGWNYSTSKVKEKE